MRTVIDLLHEGVKNYGEMPYLGQKDSEAYSTYSFVRTDALSRDLAAGFLLRGLGRGDNVAILSEGSAAWVIGEFAVLKAGGASVPLSTKLSGEEILFRLDHSEARGLLVSENNFPKFAEILDRLSRRPLVVCLSPRTPTFVEAVARTSLREGEDLFFYDELLASGRDALGGAGGPDLARRLEEIEAALKPEDTVTICYTSGTTGNPKGIMLSHRNYLHNAVQSALLFDLRAGWKTLIMLPLDHSFAHTVGIYIFLHKGLCMYFVDARGGPVAALRNLPKNLLEVNPDFLLTVPALSGNFMKKMVQGVAAKGAFVNGIFQRGLRAGIARAGDGFHRQPLHVRLAAFFPWALAELLVFPKLRRIFGRDIKFCVGGGALLEIKQQEFFNALGVPIYQGYGLTENSPIICSNAPRRHKFGTSGAIIPGLEVRIMVDDGSECRPGEIGQIVTAGASVMEGYYKNPEATAQTIREGCLWSGDLGFMDEDGFLVVTGREKALLIAADGEKYSPETIEEAVINTSRFVHQIMAHNEQCKFTAALVTVDAEALAAALPGGKAPADRVIALIRDDLLSFREAAEYGTIPVQWRPASFALIPAPFDEAGGLINSTLKLVRHKVRDRYQDRIDEVYASASADPFTEGNRAAVRALGLASD